MSHRKSIHAPKCKDLECAGQCSMQMRCEDGKFSLSVDSEQQVVKLGTSVDLGFCGARKKVCMHCPFRQRMWPYFSASQAIMTYATDIAVMQRISCISIRHLALSIAPASTTTKLSFFVQPRHIAMVTAHRLLVILALCKVSVACVPAHVYQSNICTCALQRSCI